MKTTQPKVSVCMITYNHELFIKEAIEGVLMQDVDFDIELILANDNSTDGTHTIILEFIKTHPKGQLIRYFKHSKNLGMMPNFIFALERCQGKYIALCEGDDYWTDNLKLKKQVDFLDNNTEYGICFHLVSIFNEHTKQYKKQTVSSNAKDISTIVDLAARNFIHTPSVILRNDFKIPKWFFEVALGDWSLYMIQLQGRKVKKLEGNMAVYREHNSSVWSSKTKKRRITETVKTLLIVKTNLNILSNEVKDLLDQRIISYSSQLNISFVDYIKQIKSKLNL